MSNPFKVGDKVLSRRGWGGKPMTVTRVCGEKVWTDNCAFPDMPTAWTGLRAAVAGQDYHPPTHHGHVSGHLPDGSSVQKHSAGPLYPYVLVYRDSQDPHSGRKYDVGVLGPKTVGTAWFTSHEVAEAVAEALNGR